MADTTPGPSDPGGQRESGGGTEPPGPPPGGGVRAGLVPSTYLLTTRGRKTGRPLTHPVTVVEQDGQRWLVSPYGEVSWVRNARAAGRVRLGRRGDWAEYAVREVGAGEAGPVLKRYVGVATATRPYFGADKDAPVEDFVAEADRHPV